MSDSMKNSVEGTSAPEQVTSVAGEVIRGIAIIEIGLAVIISFIVMRVYSVANGVVVLLGSLLAGLLVYGVGEICVLLARIEARLGKIEKRSTDH